MVPPSPPSHWRGGAGQAHRRWKMCDGWPAGPAPSRFYSTPIGTDPDPYSPLHSLGARLTLRLHDDACGAVRESARATNPLHRAGIDPRPLRDLAHAGAPRFVQGLTDGVLQLGGYRRASEAFPLALGPRQTGTDSFPDYAALKLGEDAEHLKHGLATKTPPRLPGEPFSRSRR